MDVPLMNVKKPTTRSEGVILSLILADPIYSQISAVDKPDSATDFYCAVAVVRAGGLFDNTTHHLVNGKCRDCKLTDTQIRKLARL
jgi:hypothetical protein